jgi:hypothetical protein
VPNPQCIVLPVAKAEEEEEPIPLERERTALSLLRCLPTATLALEPPIPCIETSRELLEDKPIKPFPAANILL